MLKETFALVRTLRRQQFDLVLDVQGLLKSGVWARLTGAPVRVGLGSREGSGLRCRVGVGQCVLARGQGGKGAIDAPLDVGTDAAHTSGVEIGTRVDEHQARHSLGMTRRKERRDPATEGVADQNQSIDPERRGHRLEVSHVALVVVAALRIVGGVTVTAQVHRDGPVIGSHDRREVVPDVRLVAEAVQEEHGNALLAPLEQVDRETVCTRHAPGSRLHAGNPNRIASTGTAR